MGESGGLIYLLLPILLLIWLIFSQRRRQQQVAAIQRSVTIGSEVMMASGVYGTVVDIDDNNIIEIELAPGVRTRWSRHAVARVVTDSDHSSDHSEDPVDDTVTDDLPPAGPASDADPPRGSG